MTFDYSKHAIEQMLLRDIPFEIVEETVLNPDSITPQDEKEIYQKTVTFPNGKDYFVRVFVNVEKVPPLVVTVYRTSKINKYK
jgi:hypothetical protein